MFFINLSYKEFINPRFFALTLSSYNKFFGILSSTEHNIFPSVNQSAYVRHTISKIKSDIHINEQKQFDSSFTIITDAVSIDEESLLVIEIEKSLKHLRYQNDHWDNAIHGYRETEIVTWKDPRNLNIMQRLSSRVFTDKSSTNPMQRVHILDLLNNGYVKPHIDSVRFCGNIIAGLSLLSDSVMRLANENVPDVYTVYALLPRRSLYIMKDHVRYKYTHEILNNGAPSIFNDMHIVRQRRISIVMRNEPSTEIEK
ncbi:Alpha-ketoglutarate-dependent dioxygenase AlkB-like [Cinara cedri]|uniref:Alpha-ketoglutarate-dependent dioxygenase AlkB-like n=1 Tax=Cinara cedri TaxID=506608 RepID=A0A5E4M8U2_9HEMI|nr:Alpha-ketoglutarate-dependent dioxygenase AlkB-like [Cinara cedri]